VFSLIGRRPAFGDSEVLFLVTGIIPYMMFLQATSAVRRDELQGGKEASPLTSTATYALANVLTHLLITLAASVTICSSMHLLGIRHALPSQPLVAIAGILLTALLAFGFGLCNAMLASMFSPWASVWRVATRGLFLLSGIFYVVDFLPYFAREILVWNPLVHGVILVRMGFYENHPTLAFDLHYFVAWGVCTTLAGLWLHRIFRRRAT
ncbi:MAG: ABC transporter permease, partial [Pseudomonadota bacterium]